MEQIITFLPGQLPGEPVFQIEMTGITYPDSHYHIERENSSIYILEYIMEGEGLLRIGEETYRPVKGDVYLLPRGKSHFYQADAGNPWKKIWMNVKGSLCDTLVEGFGLGETVLFRDCPVYPLFREFLHVCEKRRAAGPRWPAGPPSFSMKSFFSWPLTQRRGRSRKYGSRRLRLQ